MKTTEEVADKMYELIEEALGKKKYTPRELQNTALRLFGDEVDKKICKQAVKMLTDSGKCVYTGFGGVSYVEIPAED
ncbi:MAG: hypothetical protein JSW71_01585 [Gemmatimonadota bacterium]|nr:MAG: hypothetical protein JSW71_01585 [Gemmatimonadota bacterium]